MARPIIVGLDPKSDDRAAVRLGVEVARFTHSPLIVASVRPAPAGPDRAADAALTRSGRWTPHAAGQGGKQFEDVLGEHKLFATRAARRAVEGLGDDIEIEVDAPIGDPAEERVDISHFLDLLVCGSRGYGPLRAVLLGSVSRHVVAESHCPALVLPRGVESALDALLAEAPGAAAPA
jgi:nucleotide-binding universal stress UspA family protein